MKILIVEDNENSRILLESALESNGYYVSTAENGKIALETCKLNKPDLIISDILMPEMDGYALCKAVKNNDDLKSIPFVFYSATFTETKDQNLARDLGAAKFLIKPMEIDKFLEEVKIVLGDFSAKKLINGSSNIKNEEITNKEYSEVLAIKLEKKVKQLEMEQEKLKESEKKYRRLVEALRDNYFFYSHSNQKLFDYVSPAVKVVLGYEPENFKETFFEQLAKNEQNKNIDAFFQYNLTDKKEKSIQVEVDDNLGRKHFLEITEEPVYQNNNLVSVEGIVHDITKRIESEKELLLAQETMQRSQKMEAIGTLAGGIAHDFNNLLAPIIGYAELSKSSFNPNSVDYNHMVGIINAATRAKELVKQILTFAKDRDKEKKVISLKTMVKETIKFLRASIPKTIEINSYLDPKCGSVFANHSQLHQVIMNLCTNAYYAMKKTGGKLSISLTEVDIFKDGLIPVNNLKKNRFVKLEITDTGTGIEPDKIDKIFEPYFSTKPKDEGTGLGLSVVHGIITSHDGYITVNSEIGKGTSFYVYLPVTRSESEENESTQIEEFRKGSETILYVDDEKLILKVEKMQLEALGYKVYTANNGAEALDIFKDNIDSIDLVITDMTMPNMTGDELAKELIKLKNDVPIILSTGYNDQIDKIKALEMGIKDFLLKPISMNYLNKVIRKVLDN